MEAKTNKQIHSNKIYLLIKLIIIVCIIISYILQINGHVDWAIKYTIPLFGLYSLTTFFQYWKTHRILAVLSLLIFIIIFVLFN